MSNLYGDISSTNKLQGFVSIGSVFAATINPEVVEQIIDVYLEEKLTNNIVSIASDVVLYTAQDSTPEQQAQARKNIGALESDALPSAINDALAQAKTSGEFDGADGVNGTSVTVSGVTESTADGGSNIVTFSDGKSVTIKNGSSGIGFKSIRIEEVT